MCPGPVASCASPVPCTMVNFQDGPNAGMRMIANGWDRRGWVSATVQLACGLLRAAPQLCTSFCCAACCRAPANGSQTRYPE